MSLVAVALVVAGVLGLTYGVLDLIAPQLTIRWQVASTARGRGGGRAVGETFQRWYGIDPSSQPWNDRRVRRLVRWTGLLVAGFSAIVIAAGASLLRR